MKFRKPHIFLVAGALGIALVVLVGCRYRTRPFFAESFLLLGHGVVLDWQSPCGLALDDDQFVYYDRWDRVLLVVQVEGNHNVEWLVDGQPVGSRLRIRRQDDDRVKDIEWRRDCVIYLNRNGIPTYRSLPVSEFRNAITDSQTMKASLIDIVRECQKAALDIK